MRDERRKEIVEIWKTIVDVQQHFNDICMRIRSMLVTILLALFAAVGFLLDKKIDLRIWIVDIRFATVMPLFGVVGTYLFYFIDRYWYHRLLVGSVNHAIIIEKKYKTQIPELSLSEAIGVVSPYKPGPLVSWWARIVVKHEKFQNSGQLHSDGKIELFYKSVVWFLLAVTLVLALIGGITIDHRIPLASPTASAKSNPASVTTATVKPRPPR